MAEYRLIEIEGEDGVPEPMRRRWQAPNPYGLTDREWEIADLLLEGLDAKAISARLGVAGYTVRNHLSALYRKLDVRCRTGAVVKLWRFKYRVQPPLDTFHVEYDDADAR